MKTAQLKKQITSKKNAPTAYSPMHKIKLRFDKGMLDMIIGYVFCNSKDISKSNLNNLRKLFEIIDDRSYETDNVLYSRVIFIRDALDGKLHHGLDRPELLKNFCRRENSDECSKIIEHIDEYSQLSFNDIKFISDSIMDRLKYAFICFHKDLIYNTFMRLDTGEYDTFSEIVTDVKEKCNSLMNDIRKTENINSLTTFSLDNGIFEAFVEETVKNASDPNQALMTGIRMLNDMLSPGYMPGKFYLWLGITGGFKSCMLLLTCKWIKLYNRITPRKKDPGCIPTVLYITTENSVEESVIRLFNMTCTNEDISNFTPDEVVKMMRTKGGLTLNDGETNIVMKYYGNFEIDTSDLYGIIEDIEDDNKEVVALVFDYIKRIKPTEPAMDERLQLKNASNEMKDLAVKLKIPVITAQQINRAGNMTIDSAMESGKEDLARFLGRGNVAQAWDLLENSDWVGILNVEVEKASGVRYLTIKEIKKRYKSLTDVTYFNHPFEEGSTIMLVDDVNMDKSVSKLSLASDLTGVSMDGSVKGTKNAKKRQEVNPDFSAEFDFNSSLS